MRCPSRREVAPAVLPQLIHLHRQETRLETASSSRARSAGDDGPAQQQLRSEHHQCVISGMVTVRRAIVCSVTLDR